MPRGTRLFKINEPLREGDLLRQLKSAEPLIEEREISEGEKVMLQSIIRNVEKDDAFIRGELVYENIVPLRQIDGSVKFDKNAESVSFAFCSNLPFLIILADKNTSETVAFKINKMVFGGRDIILKTYFSEKFVQEFLRQNPYILLRCHWAQLRIPGVNKAALAGSDVRRAPDLTRYDMHGERTFIIIKLIESGWTIGLSRGGSIVFYSKVTEDEMLGFIREEIIKKLARLMGWLDV